jgi:Flp pilus assembly protein TadD
MIAIGTGRYEEAVQALRRIISEDPTNAEAYRQLARAYEGVDDFAQAEAVFREAVRARPGDSSSYSQLGAFLSRRRNYAEAARQFERVVALAPDNARAYSNLGGVYALLKRDLDALAAFERSVELNPAQAAALSNLATLYFRQRRYQDAARTFERATAIQARDYRIWRNLGSTYKWIDGGRDKSRAAYQRAAELAEGERTVNPRQPLLLANLADCYAHLDRPDEARALMLQAEALAPADGGISLLSAQLHEELGDRRQALARLAVARARGISRDEIEAVRSLETLRSDPAYLALR